MKNELLKETMTKNEFLKLARDSVTHMKQFSESNCVICGIVSCQSKTSDIFRQDWLINLRNQTGNKFVAAVKLTVCWKNGREDTVAMPVELWPTKKAFMEFLEREVDK